MPKGHFSPEQDAHIASFFPAFLVYIDDNKNKNTIAKWKKETAATIFKSQPFSTLAITPTEGDGAEGSATEAEWIVRITKKFENFKTQASKKGKTLAHGDASVAASSTRGPKTPGHLLNNGPLTGRELFAMERKDIIWAAAETHAAQDGVKPIAHYQTCRKEMWDGLLPAERDEYDQQASSTERDVALNQRGLQMDLWQALDNVTQGGAYGCIELEVYYAYREPAGRLVSGVISTHTPGNSVFFKDVTSDWQTNVSDPWANYAARVLPAPAPATLPAEKIEIPRSRGGIPVLPILALSEMTPASIGMVLKEYFACLWAYCRPSDGEIPWGAIGADNSLYYDTTVFVLPVPLKAPTSLLPAETYVLADFLMQRLDEVELFVFRPVDSADKATDGHKDKSSGKSGAGEGSKTSDGKEEDEAVLALMLLQGSDGKDKKASDSLEIDANDSRIVGSAADDGAVKQSPAKKALVVTLPTQSRAASPARLSPLSEPSDLDGGPAVSMKKQQRKPPGKKGKQPAAGAVVASVKRKADPANGEGGSKAKKPRQEEAVTGGAGPGNSI
ncbi:hypothetical protein C8J57DRAFT_1714412 [Mycena rebaudengoi]|nr:hypothetical protein C8J57DRAFT_1714412 [Mycena rebaudengoi]